MANETNEITMPTKYDPSATEAKWYDYWLENDVFKADEDDSKEPYTIVIPPPNVTGKLHLGHAWDTTLQDLLTRLKRMQGYDVLWLPGMDHAGIATQAKVEQKLREDGIMRYDLGREKFLEKTWEWKDEYADTIRAQWSKLGLGLDYSRERFTLDEGLSKAVGSIRPLVRERLDLPWRIYRQLGPGAKDCRLGYRGHLSRSRRRVLSHEVPARGRFGPHRNRDDASGDDARRYGRCRQPER